MRKPKRPLFSRLRGALPFQGGKGRNRKKKDGAFGVSVTTYSFSMTTPGWFFFILMILIMGAAVASGHNLLYLVVCLFFGAFVVMGNVAVMNLQKLEVEREIPEELYAGSAQHIAIRISNPRQWMDTFALEVRESAKIDDKPIGKVFLPLVEKGEETVSGYTLTPRRRGWLEFKGLETLTHFPFGFWQRLRVIPQPQRVLVYPKIYHNWPETTSNLTVEGDFVGKNIGTGDELLNFREYEPGDPIRWIHWKNTAKTDRLTVALYHQPKNRNVIVCLRTRYPKGLNGGIQNHFEEAIGWAATAAARLQERGVTVGYSDESVRISPSPGEGQRRRILTHLALVERVDSEAEAGEPRYQERGPQGEEIIHIEASLTGVKIVHGSQRRHYEEMNGG